MFFPSPDEERPVKKKKNETHMSKQLDKKKRKKQMQNRLFCLLFDKTTLMARVCMLAAEMSVFIRECVPSHVTGGQCPIKSDINRSALGSGNAQACKHVYTYSSIPIPHTMPCRRPCWHPQSNKKHALLFLPWKESNDIFNIFRFSCCFFLIWIDVESSLAGLLTYYLS